MPNKPSWLLRVSDVIQQLETAEVVSHPFLSRAAIEVLFGLKRRQAIKLMHSLRGYQIGKAFVVGRSELLAWLRRASLGEQVWWEEVRRTRVENVIQEIHQEREARKQRAVVPVKTLQTKLEGIPATVSLKPGELTVRFAGADDLFQQLFQLAQAMKNDYDQFRALAEG